MSLQADYWFRASLGGSSAVSLYLGARQPSLPSINQCLESAYTDTHTPRRVPVKVSTAEPWPVVVFPRESAHRRVPNVSSSPEKPSAGMWRSTDDQLQDFAANVLWHFLDPSDFREPVSILGSTSRLSVPIVLQG